MKKLVLSLLVIVSTLAVWAQDSTVQRKGTAKQDKKNARRERINSLLRQEEEGVRIEVEKIMKADPRRIGGINLTFHFPDSLVVDEEQKGILEHAAHTCPVMYSIHPDIEVNVLFHWKILSA